MQVADDMKERGFSVYDAIIRLRTARKRRKIYPSVRDKLRCKDKEALASDTAGFELARDVQQSIPRIHTGPRHRSATMHLVNSE